VRSVRDLWRASLLNENSGQKEGQNMTSTSATHRVWSGRGESRGFVIGGDFGAPPGFGPMRNYRQRNLGEPKDRAEAIRVLRKAVERELILSTQRIRTGLQSARKYRRMLTPIRGTGDPTKAGLERPGPDQWCRRPSRRTCARHARKPAAIAVEWIIFSTHRIDDKVR